MNGREEHRGGPIFSQYVRGQVIGHLRMGRLAKRMGRDITEHAGRGGWAVRAPARYPPVLVICKEMKLRPKYSTYTYKKTGYQAIFTQGRSFSMSFLNRDKALRNSHLIGSENICFCSDVSPDGGTLSSRP